ncbi:MAG: MogA/MoaB family molybdenum cofactor biosynthesis protein, partial [Candidatus Acidiferrales bacterium]
MRVSVLTISDSVAGGKAEDRSGPSVIARCKELGWEIVSSAVRADDRSAIQSFLEVTADSNAADVILTTGGTGLGPRDITPEATIAVVSRLIPGFPEHMRAAGATKTPRALLSRGVAGIRGQT